MKPEPAQPRPDPLNYATPAGRKPKREEADGRLFLLACTVIAYWSVAGFLVFTGVELVGLVVHLVGRR